MKLFESLLFILCFPLISSAGTKSFLGLQPVVLVSQNADGQIVKVDTRVISAGRERETISPTSGFWIVQNNLDFRREQELVRPSKAQIAARQMDLVPTAHERHQGITKKTLLIPELAPSSEQLAGYIAYAKENMIGYLKLVDSGETWVVRGADGNESYKIVGYQMTSGPRRYEVIRGEGVGRNILEFKSGQSPAKVAYDAGKFLVNLDDSRKVKSSEIRLVYTDRVPSALFMGAIRESGEYKSHPPVKMCREIL